MAAPLPAVLVIMGVSGSGKATVAASLAALEEPGADEHPMTISVAPPPHDIVQRIIGQLA